MTKWPEKCIKVDETRLLTREEYGYYWTWGGADNTPIVYLKQAYSFFYEGSVCVKLQESPPEKPEPINVFGDGWYRVLNPWGNTTAFRERRSDGGSYDVGGHRRCPDFDTAYSEYERVIGFEEVIKAK